ncbi:MAG: immunoglobulin domain-containing protein, partial [Verrucomicrobia bacterium]|nr:immunoglobulin domain-containing protein [Verrucomicrobiota bacterium]
MAGPPSHGCRAPARSRGTGLQLLSRIGPDRPVAWRWVVLWLGSMVAAHGTPRWPAVSGVQASVAGSTVNVSVFDSALGTTKSASYGNTAVLQLTNVGGVVAWIDRQSTTLDFLRAAIYDPVRGSWQSFSGGNTAVITLINADGVVAWLDRQSTTLDYVRAAIYDPARGSWQSFAGDNTAVLSLGNADGVIAWLDRQSTTLDYVRASTYDPSRGTWSSFAGNNTAVSSLANTGGVIAWVDTQSASLAYVRSAVYDPVRGTWASGTFANSAAISSLNIQNFSVVWTVSGSNQTRGYDATGGTWSSAPTVPFAYFSASPKTGNPPLGVWLWDMSIATTGWNWNFGDGGSSNARSTYHSYGGAGLFTVTQTISGTGNSLTKTDTITVGTAPAIGTQPINVTVNAASSATLSVVATGSPPLSYQWKKGGTTVDGATNAALTLASTQVADAGSYTVIVTNPLGSVTSIAATLTVNIAPPAITAQPQSQPGLMGGSVAFSVSASGSAPLSYQWKKDGADLTGATSSTLLVSNLQAASAGGYTVIVSNSAGSVTSSVAALTVFTDPGITTQPASQTVAVGGSVTFAIAAIGTPPLAYQWRKDGIAIPGATNASLSLADVQLADAGSYVAVATNATGSATSGAAVLTVNAVLPAITTPPGNQTVVAGTSVTFSVTATGAPAPTYQWRKGGVNIAGATNGSLTLANVQIGDAGSYDVIVSNTAGSVTSGAATLTVNVPPVISTPPASQTVVAGASVTFTIVVTGTPAPTYQWKRSGVDLAGATNASLTLANVQGGDAGSYTVVVTNPAGSLVSTAAVLTVNAGVAPAITTQPLGRTVAAGATVTFTVVATGTPAPAYQWRKGGANLAGATNASYTIASAASGDADGYDVVVSNSAGSVTSNLAVLTVISVAVGPTITTQPVAQTAIAGGSVTFSVVAAGTAPLSYQWRKGGVNIAGATSGTLTLGNVQPAHGGNYDVVVSNDVDSVVSNSVALTVNVAPVITTQPVAQSVMAGGSATFTVVATGTPAPVFQWRKDGADIAGATSATLVVGNVQAAAAGSYAVVVTNPAGSVTSNPAALSISASVSVALPAVKDNTIYGNGDASLSNGAGAELFVGKNGQGRVMRSLVTFDVAGQVPAGATITAVDLVLTVNTPHSNTATVGLHRATADWGEGTSDATRGGGGGAPAATGDATWNARFFNTANWTTPGGDFSATISGSQTVTGTPGAVTFATTAGMVADVQAWLDQPAANFGWLMKAQNEANPAVRFSSRQGAAAPLLRVTYTPPETIGQTIVGWGPDTNGQFAKPIGLAPFKAIAIANDLTLAVRMDGTVAAWGASSWGRLNLPAGLADVVAVGATSYYCVALKRDGTVVAWGDFAANVPVASLTDVRAISVLGEGVALKRDGTVVSWGTDNPPANLTAVAVAAGKGAVAVRPDGTVVQWGEGRVRYPVPDGLSGVVSVAASADHRLALKSDGTVVAWGSNNHGQLDVPPGLGNVVAVAASGTHSVALKVDGTVVTWGGDGSSQIAVPAGLSEVAAIAAADNRTLVLQRDVYPRVARVGRVAGSFPLSVNATGTWTVSNSVPWLSVSQAGGSGSTALTVTTQANPGARPRIGSFVVAGRGVTVYQLGALPANGSIVTWGGSVAKPPPAGLGAVTAVTAGSNYFLAVKADGTVASWGDANDSTGKLTVPAGLSGVVATATAYDYSFALKADGTVAAWGNGAAAVPTGALSGVIEISGEEYNKGLALKADGTLVEFKPGETPTPPAGVPAIAASSGSGNSIALKPSGTVIEWGGDFPNSNVPAGLAGVVAVAAGFSHRLALRADGTVVAWGGNGSGQTDVPAGLSNVVAIAAGNAHSLALKADGTVVGWGASAGANLPAGLANVTAISAAANRSAALVETPNAAPVITAHPQSQTVVSGANVTLSVVASGLPAPAYQWKKGGVNIADATNATLTLSSVTTAATGRYAVTITNSAGSVTSDAAVLLVQSGTVSA